VLGDRGAAQNDRVARLQTEGGAVDGHVGPRLVDHGDDTERHADLAQVEPVGQPARLDSLPHRIGQGGDAPDIARHPREARRGQREPVEQRVAEPAPRPGLHVARVGLEHLTGAFVDGVGHGEQRGVLGGEVEPRERA
jgi:hypothetical protein